MSDRIGILVDRLVLHRALRDRPTHEQVSLYREIALAEGIDIIVFCISDISVRRHSLRGYVPSSQGWQRQAAPIPKVIHKRVLYQTNAPLQILDTLRRRGTILVNPHRMQSKQKMHQILSGSASASGHIPPTWDSCWYQLRRQLDTGHSMIMKPKIGSVGQGILKIVPLSKQRVLVTGQSTRELSRPALRKHLRTRMSSHRYLLQQCINLAQYEGRPFDLRVPVQRDGEGNWVVAGMVAKVATGHPFLTNLAQGGHAMPGENAIKAAFAPSISAVLPERIIRLAFDVAQAVAGHYHYAADLGLDVGIDTDGKPWLIEVNTRDQRITFLQAGLHDEFRTLYTNPIAYCSHLNQKLSTPER